MKKTFLLLLFAFSSILHSQQQDKFIIGADWLNPTYPHPGGNYYPLSEEYWDTIKSFGLNYGALNLGRSVWGNSNINAELDKAATNDISIFLWTFQLYQTHGRRWMYQVEDNYDFGSHISGQSIHQDPINGEPELHWSQIKINEQAPNFWRLVLGQHNSGYVAENVMDDDQQPDSTTYYVRLKIRKRSNISGSTPIVKVWIINKNYPSQIYHTYTLTTDMCSYNVWQEKYLGSFYKVAEPPYVPIENGDNIVLKDSLGLTGIDDYTITTTTYTPYEIKIEWFGDISCDLDYVIIEDNASRSLHNGTYDNLICSVATEFLSNDGLGNIKVRDEAYKESLLPVRYTKRKIDTFLSGTGYEHKVALAYNIPAPPLYPYPHQYLAQSELDILLTDIYLFGEDFPIPYSQGYNSAVDSAFNFLTERLNDATNSAKLFEKSLWFTPQAHKFLIGSLLREPSAYEIKAMVNLGLSYGAKGIHYFMFTKPRDADNGSSWGEGFLDNNYNINPIPRYKDDYQFDKWETVKQLNYKLSTIGDELISLTWQDAFYIPDAQPNGIYITNVQSYYDAIEGPSIPDPPGEIYVQLGIFKWTDEPNNDNLEHFFIVNRRTLNNWAEQRTIEVQYNKSSSNPDNWQNWIVKEVGTENYWIDGELGEFTTHYEAGDGKLFRLEPVVMGGGNLIVNETINRDIELHGDLTIETGVNLYVNADYHCYGNIILNGGTISGNGKIYFHNYKKVIVYGTSGIYGFMGPIELDFVEPNGPHDIFNGIEVNQGASFIINGCILRNAKVGITAYSNTDYFLAYQLQFYNCHTGIIIYGPLSMPPNIIACQFNNVTEGLMATNLSEILVRGNQFINNDMGINLLNVAVPLIDYNSISSNKKTLPGIFLGSCNGAIRNNNISGHTNGIHLGNSSPDIGVNQITNNLYHGIYVGTGSLPKMNARLYNNPPLYYPISGYNQIWENGGTTTGGPPDNDGSEIFFNNSNADMQKGCNSIYDDREGSEHPPYNTRLLMNGIGFRPIRIQAEANFWSNNPQYPLRERFGNLIVDHDPFLLEPCEIPGGGGSSEELFVKSSTGEVIDTLYSVQRTVENLTSTDLLYAVAEEKFISADYIGAEERFNQIVNGSDSLEVKLPAYRRLYDIGKLSLKPESYFNNLNNVYSSLVQSTNDSLMINIFSQLGSLSLVGEEEYIQAIEEFDDIIQQNPGSEKAVYAEIDAYTTALLIEKGDTTLGKSAAQNYIVNSSDYESKISNLLKNNFGAPQKTEETASIPANYNLYQNYPNPFNPVTTIKYDLVKNGNVKLAVYDILGREITILVNEQQQPGRYEVQFNASNLSSGVYIYQLISDEYISSKKMILIK